MKQGFAWLLIVLLLLFWLAAYSGGAVMSVSHHPRRAPK